VLEALLLVVQVLLLLLVPLRTPHPRHPVTPVGLLQPTVLQTRHLPAVLLLLKVPLWVPVELVLLLLLLVVVVVLLQPQGQHPHQPQGPSLLQAAVLLLLAAVMQQPHCQAYPVYQAGAPAQPLQKMPTTCYPDPQAHLLLLLLAGHQLQPLHAATAAGPTGPGG
jgi:hypothetical protein